GDEWPHQAVQKLDAEFPSHKVADGFVVRRRLCCAECVASNVPLCRHAQKRRSQHRRWAERNATKTTFYDDIARRLGRCLHKLAFHRKFLAKSLERGRAAEALRAQFKQETIASLRTDRSARTIAGLRNLRFNARFAQRVGAR